jgi:hypothetical protein
MAAKTSRVDIPARLFVASKKQIEAAAQEATFNFINGIRESALVNLQKNKSNHSGQLRSSISTAAKAITEVKFGHTLTVGANYGIVVEFGRKPGKGIPRKVIEDNSAGLTQWVRKKMRPSKRGRVITDKDGNTRRVGRKRKDQTDEEFYRGVAYAVAGKIKRDGIKERPYIRPAVTRSRGAKGLKKEFGHALASLRSSTRTK